MHSTDRIHNTDRNGVNKQHTHTHTHTHIKDLEKDNTEKDDTSSFLKQPNLFYQSLHFYGKNLNPKF